MLDALTALLAPAMMQRLTLLINHVLASEGAATDRLKRHRGRTLRLCLDRWPAVLPPLPPMRFTVTPAGLLEWQDGQAEAGDVDLQVHVDGANPVLLGLRTLAGDTPAVEVRGDAALAQDVSWLLANLRWDVEADLERFLGPQIAHQASRLGSGLARGIRSAVRRGSDRLRPDAP